jgi:hypothetical protein
MSVRHHYVPQCYLRSFCLANRPGYIYAYQRNGSPFLANIKNVAAIKDFYIFDDPTTGGRQDLEGLLSIIESHGAPPLQKLIRTGTFDLSVQEHEALSVFIAFLCVRNTFFRQEQKWIVTTGTRQFLNLLTTDPDLVARKAKKHGFKLSRMKFRRRAQLEELQRSIIDLHSQIESGTGSYSLFQWAMNLAVQIGPILGSKEWHLLKSTSTRVFITSDNPVSAVSEDENDTSDLTRPITRFDRATIFLPISPSLCLMLSSAPGPAIYPINRDDIQIVNQLTAGFADRFLFSNLQSRDIENSFQPREISRAL